MNLPRILIAAIVGMGMVAATWAGEKAGAPDDRYDFRASPAHRALNDSDRQKLEQVCRDFTLIWGALDMYADDHRREPPQTLDKLVQRYLKELPRDPFATAESAAKDPSPYARSLDGWGYRYRPGAEGNRAWVIASVGLPDFPFLAERGNVGLYICKGTWISGINPVRSRE